MMTSDDLEFIADMQDFVRRGAGGSALDLQELLQIITTLRAELAERESDLRFEYNGRINAETKVGQLQFEVTRLELDRDEWKENAMGWQGFLVKRGAA